MPADPRRVVMITGCSSGIGCATATLLAERGWRVFATQRRVEAPPSAGETPGDGTTTLSLDVTDEDSMAAAVGEVLSRAGRIDALVNNAGYTEVGPLEEATAEEVRRQFETNTFGPLRLAQLVLPTMRAQGTGRIVNVSTIGGRISIPFIGLYTGSKFALEAMSDALRMETQPYGVRVILVEPGGVKTGFNATAARNAQRFSADMSSPYHRFFEPFNGFIERTERFSSSPDKVAEVIHRALTSQRPRPRYAATPDARLMLSIMTRLPDRARDGLLARLTGLR